MIIRAGRSAALLLTIVGCTAQAGASDMREFAETAGCIGCHAPDEIRIGPSYRAIAARYANADARVTEILARKVLSGGAGNWGVVPMIANDKLSLDQAREVVRWILRRPVGESP